MYYYRLGNFYFFLSCPSFSPLCSLSIQKGDRQTYGVTYRNTWVTEHFVPPPHTAEGSLRAARDSRLPSLTYPRAYKATDVPFRNPLFSEGVPLVPIRLTRVCTRGRVRRTSTLHRDYRPIRCSDEAPQGEPCCKKNKVSKTRRSFV